MEEEIKKLEKRDDGFVEVTLKKAKDFDEYVLAQMCKDTSCLNVIRDPNSKVKFYYDTNGYLDLLSYLEMHRFEEDEAMKFLIYLFEHLVRTNTNKPVVLQSDLIYLSYDGGILKFMALPLTMDKWVFQSEQSKAFLKELIKVLKGENLYAISGFLVEQLKGKEVSLPNVLQGLHRLFDANKPKAPWYAKFLPKKQEDTFVVNGLPKPAVIQKPHSPIEDELFMETMVLFGRDDQSSFIDQKTKAIYIVQKDEYHIGRDKGNDLCISDTFVSGKHAIFDSKSNTLTDLNSSNGTFVNHEKIQERTLNHGDIISFANHEFQFQSPFSKEEEHV